MKKFTALLLTGCLALSLVACSSSSDSSESDETAEETVEEEAEAEEEETGEAEEEAEAEEEEVEEAEEESTEKVHITVQSWQYALGDYKGFTDDDELTQAIADEFNATHDDIEVEVIIMRQEDHYTALRVDFAAGSAADVVGIAPGADLEEFKSQLEPLASYAEAEWGEDWADLYTEASFSTIRQSGDEIYAFPSAMSVSGTVWYNETLLAEGGVDSFPETWDELVEAAQSLRDAGLIPMMFGGQDDWQNYDMFLTLLATINRDLCDEVFTADGDWTDEDVVKAFEYYEMLFTEGVVQDGSLATSIYNEGYSQWKDDDGNSTIPMIFNGSWDLGSLQMTNSYYEQFSSYGIGVATFPAIEGNQGAVLSAPDVAWGVNANSENKEAAWEFVRWLCYDMQQSVVDGLGFFSVLKDAPDLTVEVADDYLAAYNVVAEAAAGDQVVGYRSSFYSDINSALFDQLQLLATGGTTPEAAAQAMADAAAELDA